MWRATLPTMVIVYLIIGAFPAAQSQQQFSTYCSSNLDGTGKCRKANTDQVANALSSPEVFGSAMMQTRRNANAYNMELLPPTKCAVCLYRG
jgi:hypothetical protein